MPTLMRGAESALEAIDGLARAGLPAQQLLAEAAQRIDRVVPSDGYFMSATDPQTTLCIGAGTIRDLPQDQCRPTWDYEFMVPDYLKFADIAQSGRAVADLHEATGGRPDRSARWREYGAATGFRAEVRTAFTLGGAMWGLGQFDRLGDSPRFSDDEKAWLERVAPLVAHGLRQALLAQPALTPATRGPGLVLLDEAGHVLSVTPEAAAWLEEAEATDTVSSPSNIPLPVEAHAFAAHVRAAIRDDGAGRMPRGRLRTRTGVWLLMHGSLLEGTDQLALIIEPAKAADVAPLIVEAYGLKQRELEVTRLIARGLATSQIAAKLHLSPHTVRDHVKAVFGKVGVSSRGELVAKVFADHYAPVPHLETDAVGA
jgi:DNA-binding CsgD family transcriptional regulator